MLSKLTFLLLTVFLLGCISQRDKVEGVIINENTEWSHSWIVNTNDTILPKVLLIGDSHVERYYNVVAEKLGNNVSCSKFTTSKSLGDPVFIKQLESILMIGDFDVISFNNGLHGVNYSIEDYSKYVPIAYKMLRKNVGESVILVNSTAIRKNDDISKLAERNEQIVERNKFLSDFAETYNIMLVDFYSVTVNNLDYYSSDGVHFNDAGVNVEAELITQKINELIEIN